MLRIICTGAFGALVSACGPSAQEAAKHDADHPVCVQIHAEGRTRSLVTEWLRYNIDWEFASEKADSCKPNLYFAAVPSAVRTGWASGVVGQVVALHMIEPATSAQVFVVQTGGTLADAVTPATNRAQNHYFDVHEGGTWDANESAATTYFRRANRCVEVNASPDELEFVRSSLTDQHGWTSASGKACLDAKSKNIELFFKSIHLPTADHRSTIGYAAGGAIFDSAHARPRHGVAAQVNATRNEAFTLLIDHMVTQFDQLYPS